MTRRGDARRGLAAVAVISVAILLTACAAGPNELTDTARAAGFWPGLWHGLISPITFLVSLFDSGVSIYEVHNGGNWYDFGFMLGVAIIFSGPARLGGSRRSRQSTRPAG